MPSPAGSPPTRVAAQAERELADYWAAYVEDGPGARRGIQHVARHPVLTWRAFRQVRRLPVLPVGSPSGTAGGRAVRDVVHARGPFGAPARWWGAAALAVPSDPAAHLSGSQAQTLRRKIRAAERLGVTVRLVRPDERDELLQRANAAEQQHPDPRYRVARPRNDDLVEHDLWLVAEDAVGEPLLLAVIPCDGEFATLRYFRTLGAGEAQSVSRYLATHALVAELARRGVRWLLDTEPPGAQTNGLRHFQRMVGFRYVRLHVTPRAEQLTALSLSSACASLEPCLERASSLPIC